MRQNKYLIKEAKENTNTTDALAISDELCVRLLNRCQSFIYSFLINKNIKTKIFRSEESITVSSSQDSYNLPSDIYAVNAIVNIQKVNGSGTTTSYEPVRQISEKDRGVKSGYFVTRNKIVLSPIPYSSFNLLVAYTRKLAELGISYGTVLSTTPTTIVLDTGYQDMTGIADYFSVVNSNGEIIVNGLPINQSGATLTVPTSVGVSAGMIVVPGYRSTTHCQLPDELESSLIFMLERLINARLSSSDLSVSSALTEEQLSDIAEMFADNSGDSFMPPIVEYTEWA